MADWDTIAKVGIGITGAYILFYLASKVPKDEPPPAPGPGEGFRRPPPAPVPQPAPAPPWHPTQPIPSGGFGGNIHWGPPPPPAHHYAPGAAYQVPPKPAPKPPPPPAYHMTPGHLWGGFRHV